MQYNFFADLHSHPSMKPFSKSPNSLNSPNPCEKHSIWNTDSKYSYIVEKIIEGLIPVAKYKQSDFQRAIDGNVRVIFLSITPPETDYFKIKFLSFSPFLQRHIGVHIADFITEFGVRRIKRIKGIGNAVYDYFQELKWEYKYITQMDGQNINVNGVIRKYIIARNFEHLQQILRDPDQPLAVILTIEGAHALISGDANTRFQEYMEDELNDLSNVRTVNLMNEIYENINSIKSWYHPGEINPGHRIFFITFCHHFWHMMGGHSVSLPGIMNKLLDQTRGVNTEITRLGKRVLKRLLCDDDGKRILIDTRHMSIPMRRLYYRYVRIYNRINPNGKIPIISSHTGVNIFPTMQHSDDNEVKVGRANRLKVIADRKYKQSDIFNNWCINLSDEEICIIHDSGGLIGISLDQRIISGHKEQQKVKRIKKRNPNYYLEWAGLVYNQVEHIFTTIYNHRLALSGDPPDQERSRESIANIMIGSDFDGIMNPIDGFRTFADYPSLRNCLRDHIANNIAIFPGLNADFIVEAITCGNAMAFLQKHFI